MAEVRVVRAEHHDAGLAVLGRGLPAETEDIYTRAGVSSAAYYRMRKDVPEIRTALAVGSSARRSALGASPLEELRRVKAERDELRNVIANLAVTLHQRERAIEELRGRLERQVRQIGPARLEAW